MRDKVRAARPVKAGLFDVKHSPGGMMDAEFAVQYLVLTQAAAHPELLDNVGNIALLQRAEALGLLPAGVGDAAADAYRELRRAQHRARLDEQPTQVSPETLAEHRDAILALSEDAAVSNVLVILSPHALTEPVEIARAIVEVAPTVRLSLCCCWMGGGQVEEGRALLERLGTVLSLGLGRVFWIIAGMALTAFAASFWFPKIPTQNEKADAALPAPEG